MNNTQPTYVPQSHNPQHHHCKPVAPPVRQTLVPHNVALVQVLLQFALVPLHTVLAHNVPALRKSAAVPLRIAEQALPHIVQVLPHIVQVLPQVLLHTVAAAAAAAAVPPPSLSLLSLVVSNKIQDQVRSCKNTRNTHFILSFFASILCCSSLARRLSSY